MWAAALHTNMFKAAVELVRRHKDGPAIGLDAADLWRDPENTAQLLHGCDW